MKLARFRMLLTTILLAAVMTVPAGAATVEWTTGSGDWDDDGNWSGSAPGGGDTATFGDQYTTGTVELPNASTTGGAVDIENVYLEGTSAAGGPITLDLNNGTLTVGNDFKTASAGNVSGHTIIVKDGTLDASGKDVELGRGSNVSNNTMIFDNVDLTIGDRLLVGIGGDGSGGNNEMIFRNGSTLTNPRSIVLDINTDTPNQTVTFTGTGTVGEATHFIVGGTTASTDNTIRVLDGAVLNTTDDSEINIVGSNGASGHTLKVGDGAVVNLNGRLVVGDGGGTGNQLVLEGGTVNYDDASPGDGPSGRLTVNPGNFLLGDGTIKFLLDKFFYLRGSTLDPGTATEAGTIAITEDAEGDGRGLTTAFDAVFNFDIESDTLADKLIVEDRLNLTTAGGGAPTINLGVLDISLLSAGTHTYDVLDWGTLDDSTGESLMINTQADPLIAAWDTSNLLVDGTVSITVVPEPMSLAMGLAGLGVLGLRRRAGARL